MSSPAALRRAGPAPAPSVPRPCRGRARGRRRSGRTRRRRGPSRRPAGRRRRPCAIQPGQDDPFAFRLAPAGEFDHGVVAGEADQQVPFRRDRLHPRPLPAAQTLAFQPLGTLSRVRRGEFAAAQRGGDRERHRLAPARGTRRRARRGRAGRARATGAACGDQQGQDPCRKEAPHALSLTRASSARTDPRVGRRR